MNNSKTHNLEQGAALLFLSTILAKIIAAFFKIPISADYCLGDLGFGYFASVHDLITPIHTLAVSGLPVAVSHLVARSIACEKKDEAVRVFYTSRKVILLIACITALLFLALSYPFVMLSDKTGKTIYSAYAMVPAVFFCLLTSVYRGYYEGIRNMTPAAFADVLEALGKLILGFSLAFITVKATGNAALGSAAAVIGVAIGAFISLLFLMLRFGRDQRALVGDAKAEAQAFDKNLAKTVVALSFPIAIASVSGNLISVIDTLTVRTQLAINLSNNPDIIYSVYSDIFAAFTEGADKTLSTAEIPTLLYGIRSKAYTLYNLIPTLTVALGVAAVPNITNAFAKNDINGTKQAVASVIRLGCFVAMPASVGVFSISGAVFSLLYGEGPSAELGGRMLAIYAIAGLFAGVSVVLSSVLQAVNKQKAVLINVLVGITVKIALNLILSAIPQINIFGSVYATLVCFAVILTLNLYTLFKSVGAIGGLPSSVFKIFTAAVFCGITAFAVSKVGDMKWITVFSILAAAVVYFALILGLKVFSKSDVERFPGGKIFAKLIK